jgi:hypothetical protein
MKDCKNCESELISQIADISIENDKLRRINKIYEQCLDVKEELNKALREDNEELRSKLRTLKELLGK